MPTRRSHKGNTVQTTLFTSCTASDTTLVVVAGSTYPDGSVAPFVITLDPGLVGEEKCLVTSRSGNTLSGVTRGYDDTVAGIHAAGANVRHTLSAVELEEAAAHIAGTTSVHGIADTAALLVKTGGTMTGELVVPDLKVTGLTGTTLPTRLVGGTASGAPTAGTWQALDEITDATGKKFICTVAGTPGTWVQVGASLPLLALVQYAPTTGVSKSTTSITLVAVDTTNLTFSFTAPASGRALVRLTAIAIIGGTFAESWGLVTHGTSTQVGVTGAVTNAGTNNLISMPILLTGLTPGAVYALDWAWQTSNATGTASMNIGANTNNTYSPATMEVWSA
jgi:hypothetical protein